MDRVIPGRSTPEMLMRSKPDRVASWSLLCTGSWDGIGPAMEESDIPYRSTGRPAPASRIVWTLSRIRKGLLPFSPGAVSSPKQNQGGIRTPNSLGHGGAGPSIGGSGTPPGLCRRGRTCQRGRRGVSEWERVLAGPIRCMQEPLRRTGLRHEAVFLHREPCAAGRSGPGLGAMGRLGDSPTSRPPSGPFSVYRRR